MNKTIETQITFKSYEEGGRIQLPVGSGYSPHFQILDDTQLLGVRFIDFPNDAEFDKPCNVKVELLYYPEIDYCGLIAGVNFYVKEGPKTIATGTVLKGT